MNDKMTFDKTEESVYTLFSLSILAVQAFESLFNTEDILNADFDSKAPVFQEMVNDTIHEALVYQILLKSCSYLDEWDKIFGVKTETRCSFLIDALTFLNMYKQIHSMERNSLII